MGEYDIVNLIIEDNFINEQIPKDIEDRRERILENIQALRQIQVKIREIIKNYQFQNLQNKTLSSQSLLYNVLGATTYEALPSFGSVQNLTSNQRKGVDELGEQIAQGYEISSKILQDLGYISPVKYSIYYRSDTFQARLGDIELDPKKDLKYEVHRNNLVIRIKSSSDKIKQLIKKAKNSQEIISTHYKYFIKPYEDVSDKNSNWVINYGYASEAFERHWELKGHSIEELAGFKNNESDYGTVGHRWYLYILSSGNDPFYTGPDTAEAQVKNLNASIISNGNTILAVIAAILKIIDTKINPDATEMQKILTRYKQAFQAKQTGVKHINRNLWDKIDETSQQEIINALGATGVKVLKNKVRLTL